MVDTNGSTINRVLSASLQFLSARTGDLVVWAG
jgi:hypothetical protein